MRGREVSRLEGFRDAVIGFALTLVLSSPLPAAAPWSPASGVVRAVTYFGDDALNLLGRARKE